MSRHFLFKHYWWISLAIAVVGGAAVLHFAPDGRVGLLASVLAGAIGLCYFAQQQKLAEMTLFTTVFEKFNRRYDEMNETLARIPDGANELDPKVRNTIIDYFNLCAEEYLYFSEGYIPRHVWRAWCAGTLVYFRREAVQGLWDSECAPASYYGLTLKVIEQGAE